MIILGIDPGYERLGIGLVQSQPGRKDEIIFSTCLVSERKDKFEDRLWFLATTIEKIIKKYKPDLVAVEKIFFSSNQKTAILVAEVRGMITYLARKFNLPIINLTPLEIKSSVTGYGQASKDQVKKMVELLLKPTKTFKYDDEIDALAIALTGFIHKNRLG